MRKGPPTMMGRKPKKSKVTHAPEIDTKLSPSPDLSKNKARLSVVRIEKLLGEMKAHKRYLEIGVERGETFEAVTCGFKCGVDPFPRFDLETLPDGSHFYPEDSNTFFSKFTGDKFDVIFVDGLHEARQTYRDVVSASKLLAKGGAILLDDVWPTDWESSLPNIEASKRQKKNNGIEHSRWYGDVYKVVQALQDFHPETAIQLVGNPAADHVQAIIKMRPGFSEIRDLKLRRGYFDSLTFAEVLTLSPPSPPWKDCVSQDRFVTHNSTETQA